MISVFSSATVAVAAARFLLLDESYYFAVLMLLCVAKTLTFTFTHTHIDSNPQISYADSKENLKIYQQKF